MKKVKDFFVKNIKKILTVLSAIIIGTCLVVLTLTVQQRVSHRLSQESSKLACHQAYRMMCVQMHTCTNMPVAICDELIDGTKPCEGEKLLPSEDVIHRCTEQLRHVQCDGELPPSCGTFME
jgi:hypothetical protein